MPNIGRILKGGVNTGRAVGNLALFGSDQMSKNMSKLDTYDPKHPAFAKAPSRLGRAQQQVRKGKKESVKLASAIRIADLGMNPHYKGVASLMKTASGVDAAFRNELGKRIGWGAALAAGAATVGFGLDIVGHGIMSGIHAAQRRSAYQKYLKESGAKDSATERKTFNAAYHMNPHLMSNPVLADAAIKQVRNYGGFDINLAGNLGKAMPGKTPQTGPAEYNKAYGKALMSPYMGKNVERGKGQEPTTVKLY